MPTPMQETSYELLVRSSSMEFDTKNDWRREKLLEFTHEAAIQVNTAITDATTATNRETFMRSIGRGNTWIRRMKVLLRVLDDLGAVPVDGGHELHSLAEEVQRLILAALRTAKSLDRAQMRNGA